MKRWGPFACVFLLIGVTLIVSQRQKISARAGTQALLFFVADTQHELTRLPVAFARLSDEDEINIGNDLAKRYLSDGQFAKEDPTPKTVQSYIERVGARVAGQAHRKLPYKFHYVPDQNFINAFALPGGHVFIGGGLMALMDSEDQLANVLGHEVEHIDHYHCAERIQTEATVRSLPLGGLVAIPVEIFEAGYSKTQELEADREGTRLAVKAGYSPLGAIRMFQVFDQLFHAHERRAQSPEEELSSVAWKTLEGYFRSHPLPAERIAQIQKMMVDENWEGLTNEKTLEVAYVFLTERARQALEAKNYAAAEKAATHSLEVHPDQPMAVEYLADAQFAQEKFPAALANYRKLLEKNPSNAGAVAAFANAVATETLAADHYSDAEKFATASLSLQVNNARALIILSEAEVAQANFGPAGATYRKLKSLYPDEATNVVSFTRSFAVKARDAHRFDQAAKVAAFWLTLDPEATEALTFQAEAGLAMGNFAASAKAFRNLLDLTPKDQSVDMNLVWSYADSLSATQSPQEAAQEFGTFMARQRTSTPALEAQIKIEWVGLMLMAGNKTAAEELTAKENAASTSGIAPESLKRLGWWYYRAGQYPAAEALLVNISQQRPGDVSLQHDLGWVELQLNETDKALVRFRIPNDANPSASPQWNTPEMGLAIALWKSNHADDALGNYQAAAVADPRWLNDRLVRAFYSPLVVRTVAEMQTEQARRLEAKRRHP